MKTYRRVLALLVTITSVSLVLAGCTSGSGESTSSPSSGEPAFNAAVNGTVAPSTTQGGTLKLLSSTDCDSWDPARTYYAFCWNLQRMFTRSLVGYSKVNGSTPQLAPDLATDLGTHNADYTVWTYTLKSGLTWSDGTPITTMDVKYGIERLFATNVISGGPSAYFIQTIAHPDNYLGPYTSGDLSSIQTTADTITFNLSIPYADFNSLMAMAAASPVPTTTEGGTGFVGVDYEKHPMSSGPFMISSYTADKSITLVRNPYWKKSTDTIRTPLAQRIVITIDSDSDDIDRQLAAGTADARVDGDIGSTLATRLLAADSLKRNVDNPTARYVSYFAVMPSVIPNKYCRQAIFYTTNKAALVKAYGGATAAVVANSMTPVTIPGHSSSANRYSVGKEETGNLTAAKAALVKCGTPTGFSTKMAYQSSSATDSRVFAAERTALARVGIKITAATAPPSTYYSSYIGSPANIVSQGIGLAVAEWSSDLPTGYGFWNSIANGANIVAVNNTNYPSLNDPVVNAVLSAAQRGTATANDFRSLDDRVMKDAVYLPIAYGKGLYYRGSRLTNVRSDNALSFGVYDFVNVGVREN